MQGVELALGEIHLDEKQAVNEHYDAEADDEEVAVEAITGGGETHKFTLPPSATVLMLKQQVERDAGFKSAEVKLYVHDDLREEELENGETLGSLRRGEGLAVLITLMVHHTTDTQEVIAGLAAEADLVLGDGKRGDGDDQLCAPVGVAFVPDHPDWLVTTESRSHRVKISNIHTGALICKFGERGDGVFDREGNNFSLPWGVAVTSDSSFVVVVDHGNHRVKVLRLVVAADGSSAHLQFVRHIGNGRGCNEGQFNYPTGVALLPGEEGGSQETMLVTDYNHRVSQFNLVGTFVFVRIFAGTSTMGSGDGEFHCPRSITVLGSSGEVAVIDSENHRVQIFDREGNYKRQFGSAGKDTAVRQLYGPAALAADADGNLLVLDDANTNRLQVFSPEGTHLCTRNDLGINEGAKGIAWSDDGTLIKLAIANGKASVLLWRVPK
jgi:DNA-binding beta-propeller fold protein YncE